MVDDNREVCLEEEVEKRRRSGMTSDQIAHDMGVDPAWIEQVLAMNPDEETLSENRS